MYTGVPSCTHVYIFGVLQIQHKNDKMCKFLVHTKVTSGPNGSEMALLRFIFASKVSENKNFYIFLQYFYVNQNVPISISDAYLNHGHLNKTPICLITKVYKCPYRVVLSLDI